MELWRLPRRVGRLGIGLVSFVVGCLTLTVAVLINLWTVDRLVWQVWLLAGFGGAVGTFAVFERLGLAPEDDWDPPTTLSLRDTVDDRSDLARIRGSIPAVDGVRRHDP
jgi:hypothetical protein